MPGIHEQREHSRERDGIGEYPVPVGPEDPRDIYDDDGLDEAAAEVRHREPERVLRHRLPRGGVLKKEILYFLVHLDILNSYRIAEKPASVN